MDRATDEDEGRGHITNHGTSLNGQAKKQARLITYVPLRQSEHVISDTCLRGRCRGISMPDEDTIECTGEEARTIIYLRASTLNVVRTQHMARQNGRR